MLELLGLLDHSGFSCWIFSGGGTDFRRAWTDDVYGLPPHRVIGSVGETEFRVGDRGPELVKTPKLEIINDGPHNRTLQQLVVHHTDGDREYAYDRDPLLGSGTHEILTAAAEHTWTVIDMASDWAIIHPDAKRRVRA
jgi:hypothetical protein